MGMSFEGFDKGGSDKNNNRIYIAIDLKSFYASVECVERGLDPLTTNLVVADESRTEKTICLAVSPSLKAYGISGRARLFEVVQKVKEIKAATGKQVDYIVAKPRMAYYLEWKDGKAVKAILTATIPGIFHVKMPEGVIRAKAIIDGQSNNYTGKTISLSLPEKTTCMLLFE